ncbi:MAG: hypothetical protein AMXMBFR42_25960 [Burkholderiales bacterium]
MPATHANRRNQRLRGVRIADAAAPSLIGKRARRRDLVPGAWHVPRFYAWRPAQSKTANSAVMVSCA